MSAADTITKSELADLIEIQMQVFVAKLRDAPPTMPGIADVERDAAPTADPAPTAVTRAPAAPAAAAGPWVRLDDLEGQSYSWPEVVEEYQPFEVWESRSGERPVQIGFGNPNNPGDYYGRERGYWVAFEMVNGTKRRPIGIFMEPDDFETSGDLIAVIKGNGDGGRSMFDPGDELPAGYEKLDTVVFLDSISGPRAYNKMALVARGGDRQAVCTHAALQLGLRP